MRYTDYKIVNSSSIEFLTKKVNELLLEGYTLIGGLSSSHVFSTTYSQAVAKPIKESDV